MKGINNCLKEWNATIEALGQEKQTILIRTYITNRKEFLLYPTVNYSSKDNYLDNFKDKYRSFVEKNTLPKKVGDKVEIKYYATLEDIIEKSPDRIGYLKNQYIWTPDQC